MQLKHKMFRGTLASWDELFGQAADYCTEVGPERVVNVSHACAGSDGTVVVWYWSFDQGSQEVTA